ncbi:MFS transporter [Trichlorobacter lovleyi]|uniref:Major facilitator superfamily MFS_1 n=1 Tax=Trichlorobacter lovleyi (strain ATCC BAA-1151 / DSM 17278 / SZ) TaxID=398767 RepID=B3E3Q4_TRIL1|nr:MFS transporter [Trichlorobacter lovleyi]ACD97326.1 major facilitator superfamily MFS_1 [Trichlorobacter lovleyi SZ]
METRSLFRALFLINFAITLGFGIADAFFSMYVFSLGARGILLVLPLVLYSLSKILFSPFMGACSDKIGPRRIASISLGLYLLVSICYFFTTSLMLITIMRLFQGIGCAMFRPLVASLVGERTTSEKRATVLGTFDISFYGALSVGPVVGGILKDIWGFEGIFAVLTLLCIVALLVALFYIPAQRLSKNHAAERKTENQCKCRTIFTMARQNSLRGLLAFIFGRACGISLLSAFLPILLTTKLGLSGIQTGLVMASGSLVFTLLLRPIGMLSDKTPRKPLIVAGGTIVSLLYFLIPVVSGFSQILFLGLGIGMFSVLSQPACTTLLIEEGVRHGMGLTVGIFNSVLNLGFIAGPLFGAGMQHTFGLSSVFYAAGILGFVAVGLFITTIVSEDTPSSALFLEKGDVTLSYVTSEKL